MKGQSRSRNEDEFGVIKDKTHKFNSIEEASNYTKDLREKLNRRAAAEEFPINTAFPEDRKKFINYALTLLTRKNLPFTDERKIVRCKAVLWLMAQGYTYTTICHWLKKNVAFKATIAQVKEVEREGMRLVKECIDKVKGSKIPILEAR